MKVFVTGADGLLGSNLVRGLLSRDFEVKTFVHPASVSPTLDGLPVEKETGDLTGDAGELAWLMEGCDAVFHCAAITDQFAETGFVWSVNYDGARNVLEACEKAKVGRLVFVGSASCFRPGTPEAPGDETGGFPDAYRGEAYAESKHAAMKLVRERVGGGKIEAVIVAPTFMIGPYDYRPSSGELIRQFITRGLKIASPGGRNFAHVNDVVTAMINALNSGKNGETYIAGGQNYTYMEFFSMVASIAQMPPPKVVLPKAAVLAGGVMGSVYEKITRKRPLINYRMARLALVRAFYTPAKAVEELNMPQTPIERAIEDNIASLKEYGHIG